MTEDFANDRICYSLTLEFGTTIMLHSKYNGNSINHLLNLADCFTTWINDDGQKVMKIDHITLRIRQAKTSKLVKK